MVRTWMLRGLQKLQGFTTRVQSGTRLGRRWGTWTWAIALGISLWIGLNPSPALASLSDDRFDGEIFALYAGNGSLMPPKVNLAQALMRSRPVLLVLYTDDSRDCKQFSAVVSQVQAFYGRVTDIVPVRADAILPGTRYAANEPGYYFQGQVPQTVLFDATGKVVLNQAGNLPFETLDDRLRELFDLLPRSESVELTRRSVNEITTELVK